MKSLALRPTAVVGAVLFAALSIACGGGAGVPSPASAPAPVSAPAAPPAPAAVATAPQGPAPAPARPKEPAEPPAAKDIDPSGSYDVSLAYGGQPLEVTLEIGKGTDGTLGGSIYADQVPAIALNSVSVTGKRVQATLTSPDGSAVTLDFTVDGADLKGSWRSSNGDGSPLSGRKLP